MPVSVVLNALGHERWIRWSLACVRWADEVVVTDMGMDAPTRAAVEEAGATVVGVPRHPVVEPARATGVEAASHEWVLVLDPDELVPASLARRLLQVVEQDEADVVYISYRNHLLGAEIRHTGWGMHPDRHPRFFRRGSLVFDDAVHSVPRHAPGTRVLVLDAREELSVTHLNYTGVSSYLAKLDRYTTAEAQTPRHRSGRSAAWAALREVWRRWVTYRGFRDGWRGGFLSVMQGVYVLVAWAKTREQAESGGEDGILRAYEEIAAGLVADHG